MMVKTNNAFQIATIVVIALLGLSLVVSTTGFGVTKLGTGASDATPICTDSDDGYGANLRGTCSNNNGDFTDYCVSENQLNEYFCMNYNCEVNIVTCGPDRTCVDGRCIFA